jgi:hypothetical protein
MMSQFIAAFTPKEETLASVSSVHLLIKTITDLSVKKTPKAPSLPHSETVESLSKSPKFRTITLKKMNLKTNSLNSVIRAMPLKIISKITNISNLIQNRKKTHKFGLH